MKKYQVKIEEQICPNSYSLDELLDLGLLDDYDPKIMVRAVGETQWRIARNYPYSLSENSNVAFNNDGSVARKTVSANSGYRIDEYGQIVRTNPAPLLSVSTDTVSFLSSGGSKTVTVTSNGSWYISTQPCHWGHVDRNGNLLTIRVDSNPGERRTDFIKIKSGNLEKRISINQSASSTSSQSVSSVPNIQAVLAQQREILSQTDPYVTRPKFQFKADIGSNTPNGSSGSSDDSGCIWMIIIGAIVLLFMLMAK